MFKINPLYKFIYKVIAKIIAIFLLFLLASYLYTAGFAGCIILATFVYVTAGIAIFDTIKFIINYFSKPNTIK